VRRRSGGCRRQSAAAGFGRFRRLADPPVNVVYEDRR
jgi:hypothetical protein